MQSLSSFRKIVSNRSMGIEIECYFDYHFVPPIDEYAGFFYINTDGSIHPDLWDQRGREFVSQPLPAKWLRKEISRLGKKYTWMNNDSCGIHVHVGKKWLSLDSAKKIQAFYNLLEDEDRKEFFGRESNGYCSPGLVGSRYKAINTTNDKTIEFRMFSSGSPAWAQYCTHMVEWMINNANHLNVDAAYAASDLYRKQYGL